MFKTKLKTFKIEKGVYALKSELIYKTDDLEIIVPVGFKTDLASVPKPLKKIWKPFGKYSRSAVLHDYLYETDMDRKECDKLFKEAMISDDVNPFTIDAFYIIVRLFGWTHR